uniref:Uncharacterized protein n=1 Tax=Ditylenchus dipsaci TaxID=166011 RepID=A0A915CWL4_9BILA
MNLFIFCVLLVALSNFNVLLTFGEKPVSDTDFNENAQKKHENGNEEDISLTSALTWRLLRKNICKNHQSSANGITWKVSTKTSKAGKIIVVFFKDQHGNLVQAQKWIKSKKIHVHIQNKEGLFIKLSGQSLDKGPSSASSFRLFIGDKAGNHVKEFESSKKRRVKYLDVDAGEDVENSYTIQFKNLKAIGKGGWCSKCNAKKSSKISSSSSSKIGFQWVGFGPAGFGFGSPQPTRDCGCEKHEQGEELGLDFDLFKEDGGSSALEGKHLAVAAFQVVRVGLKEAFLKCLVAGVVEEGKSTTNSVIAVDGTIHTDLVLAVVVVVLLTKVEVMDLVEVVVEATDSVVVVVMKVAVEEAVINLDLITIMVILALEVIEAEEAKGIISMEVAMEAADIILVAANLVAQKRVKTLKLWSSRVETGRLGGRTKAAKSQALKEKLRNARNKIGSNIIDQAPNLPTLKPLTLRRQIDKLREQLATSEAEKADLKEKLSATNADLTALKVENDRLKETELAAAKAIEEKKALVVNLQDIVSDKRIEAFGRAKGPARQSVLGDNSTEEAQ